MLQKNPILCVGLGIFAPNTELKLLAHNNYVQNFAELGYSSYFVVISILWFTFKGAYLIDTTLQASENLKAYARMSNVILVMYGAATFFVVMELDLLYIVIGLAISVYLVARQENECIPALKFRFFDTKMVIAVMLTIQLAMCLAAVKQIL